MEVQSFVLCRRLQREDDSNEYVLSCPSATFEVVDEVWPAKINPCFYMMLKRSTMVSRQVFSLLFNLIDEDGVQMASPRDWRVEAAVQAGQRFGNVAGQLFLEFPKRGLYRLEVSVLEPLARTLYSYDICLE